MNSFLLDFNFDNELNTLLENENNCIELGMKLLKVNSKEAREALDKGIRFTLENGLYYGYAYFNFFMARILVESDMGIEALKYINEAYNSFEEEGYEDEVLMAMNMYMVCYLQLEDIENCLQWAVMGMDLAEMTGNQVRLSDIKNNLASLYMDMRNYKDARDIHIELEKLDIVTSKENKPKIFIGRAWCEAELDNIEVAREYLEIAMELSKGHEINMAGTYFVEGLILLKEGKFSEAEEKTVASLKLTENSGYTSNRNDNYLLLGRIYLEQNKLKEAIDILNNLKVYMEGKERKNFLKEIYSLLEKVYEKQEDYKKAYEYAKKAASMERESLLKLNNKDLVSLQRKKEDDEERTYKVLYRQTENLYGVGNKITSNLNKENIFNIIAEEIQNIIDYDIVQIATYSDKKDAFIYEISVEQGHAMDMDGIIINKDTVAGYCIKNNEDVLINDIDKEYDKYLKAYENYDSYRKSTIEKIPNISKQGAKSAIFVPIVSGETVIGLTTVQSYRTNAYDLKDLTTLKILATYIGIALENSQLYQKMEYTATHDYLTGLLNRRETIDRSEALYSGLEEGKESLIVAIMDVDNFKKINDTYGHLIGDKVIESIGATLKNSLGEEAIVGRYGGEEFVAVFKGNNFINGEFIGEFIRKNIEELDLKTKDGKVVKTTVSIGMVEALDKNKSFEEIVGIADKAMYKGKNSGKNKLVYEKKVL